MDWTNEIEDIFQRHSGQGGSRATAAADPHQDFQQVASAASPNVIASGISQACRPGKTPPFSEMLSNLFSQSDPSQRAGVLMSALPGLGGPSSLLSGGSGTPEQASQVSPAQVQQMAAHAEKQNPSIVDEVRSIYARHPQVMKASGGLALSITLRHMVRR